MKSFLLQILTAALFLSLVGFSSCGTDDPAEPSATEIAFGLLAGDWSFGAGGGITRDGQDESLNYPNFTLSFTDGGYQTTNGGDLFRATGTWQWSDDQAGGITLDTGEEVTILSLSLTNLRFSFDHAGTGGVANGISGTYTVTLNK